MKKLMHVQEYLAVSWLQALLLMTDNHWQDEPRDTTVLLLQPLYLHESLKIQIVDCSTCSVWKHFTSEVILHSIVKYTNEEDYREGENDFDLSMCNLQSFIALQHDRGIAYFIFFTIMSHVRFTAILKSLSFPSQNQTDSQQYVLLCRHQQPRMNENTGENFL